MSLKAYKSSPSSCGKRKFCKLALGFVLGKSNGFIAHLLYVHACASVYVCGIGRTFADFRRSFDGKASLF